MACAKCHLLLSWANKLWRMKGAQGMELDPLPASLMMGLLQGDVYEQAKAGGEWGWGLW